MNRGTRFSISFEVILELLRKRQQELNEVRLHPQATAFGQSFLDEDFLSYKHAKVDPRCECFYEQPCVRLFRFNSKAFCQTPSVCWRQNETGSGHENQFGRKRSVPFV